MPFNDLDDWHLAAQDFVGEEDFLPQMARLQSEILGAETNRAVLVKLRDPGALARSQGAAASLAQQLAPATIEAKVFDTLAQKLREALAQQHVDADVTVVEPSAFRAAGSSHLASDLGLAIGGAGLAALIYWLATRRKK